MASARAVAKPRITIITPVLNEAAGLESYRRAITDILFSRTDADYRVLFVDDGSRDESWRIIERFCAEEPRMRGIRLSRNFGAHSAIAAAMDRAEGDAVAVLACDLQDPAETLVEFVERWRAGADIVWGVRRQRVDSRWRIWASNLFFRLVRRFAMPRGSLFATGSFLLADRRVVECYRQFNEHNRVTFALIAWTGFDQARVEYDRRSRDAGRSRWTFIKMMRAMYDTFIAFSDLPARAITWIGLGVWLLTLLLSIYFLFAWLTTNVLPGWTGLMVAMMVLFGLLFLVLGVVAQYLHRIYAEATRRPIYFIARETPPAELS